jgi:NDP-sugar pyrophosphorylase family protein
MINNTPQARNTPQFFIQSTEMPRELVGSVLDQLSDINFEAIKAPWLLHEIVSSRLSTLVSLHDLSAQIASTAVLDESKGTIVLEAGASVGHFSIIKGPCYIGKNCQVREHCLVQASSLEADVIIRPFSEIKRSLVMQGTHIHASLISDSVIGENCRIAARTTTANRRLDRGEISVTVAGERIATGRTSLGLICGHRVTLGVGVTCMPGIQIGSDAVIFPGEAVYTAVEAGATVRSQ